MFGVSRTLWQYKVVSVYMEEEQETPLGFNYECQIYIVGSGSCRRIAGSPPMYVDDIKGAFLNGNLHWLARKERSSLRISCLDLEI